MENTLKSLEQEFADSRYAGVLREVLVGEVGAICTERAESLDAELIVLPSHGRSGISRLLLGSQAESIVRSAKCPVLILKTHSWFSFVWLPFAPAVKLGKLAGIQTQAAASMIGNRGSVRDFRNVPSRVQPKAIKVGISSSTE